MEKYMKELGYDPKSFVVNGLKSTFGHVYYIWKTFKQELGAKDALEAYGAVWDAIASASFAQAVQNLGIKEVSDIATLGRIIEYCGFSIPSIYETVENTADRHIGHILWCANPAYGPYDCIYDRHEYYRNAEVPLTVHPYLTTLINEAKKMGLKGEVEISVPVGRCRDGNASFCQWHLWRKGTPEIKEEFDPAKRFVEDEIGDEEPLAFVMRKQGKRLEDLVPSILINFIFVDMKAWDGLEQRVGKEKALKIYQKLWLNYARMWVREAKLELQIGRVVSLRNLAKIIAFCEKKRFVPYKINRVDSVISMVGKSDPFVEIPISFLGQKVGASYFEAVAKTDQAFVIEIIDEVGMSDKVKVVNVKKLARGDDRNEINFDKNRSN